ncbi:hypothetical protein ACTXT7_005392 [Hymenolepis weldensis]
MLILDIEWHHRALSDERLEFNHPIYKPIGIELMTSDMLELNFELNNVCFYLDFLQSETRSDKFNSKW